MRTEFETVHNAGGVKSNYLSVFLMAPQSGEVHSIFAGSLNLVLNDALLHIGSARKPLSGFGMALPEPQLHKLLGTCSPGDRVVWRPPVLRIYGSDTPQLLDLDALREVDVKIRTVGFRRCDILSPALMRMLDAIDFSRLTGICPDETTGMYIRRLTGEGDIPYREVLSHFTGRGLGLTPGGDDLLYGYTLSQKLLGQNQTWIQAWEQNDWSRTTDVSRAYATALARGYAGQEWIQLAALLKEGSERELRKAVTAIQRMGHTSGNDALMGFSIGIRAIK